MSEIRRITTPLTDESVAELKSGDNVLISGVIYAGRDTVHKRLNDLLNEGKELPFDIRGAIIYYVGPAPAKPGHPIGPAGPTTSYRMDTYTPRLLDLGLRATIGKGNRSPEVVAAMVKNRAVYLAAIGGAAALIAKSIREAKIMAWEELGPEALHRLVVKDMPAVVINDIYGNDLYAEGAKKFARSS